MSLLLIAVISLAGIILGRLLFRKWINHLTSYSVIMGGLTFLYELKLLPYTKIIPLAWFFFAGSFLAFLLGIVTVLIARDLFVQNQLFTIKSKIKLDIFADQGKTLRNSVIFFSVVALFVAVQRWFVLIHMFGSIPAVIINASLVYRLNHEEVKEFIPILPAFVYVAVFLSAIYTAYKCKFTFLSFFPFIAIVLKELTYFGRAELLLTLIEFLFAFFLFRHLLNEDSEQKFKFSKTNAVIASTVLFIFLIVSASFIRVSRGKYENFSGASKGLNQLKGNFIISPSIYLYLSSDAGVFSKYLQAGGEDVKIGENTFFIGYVFLSYLGIMDRPEFFSKGYYIPMWTNTGTYLRELHADFGVTGVLLGPFLIGLIITWLWFRFYEKKSLIVFAFLVYFYLIIGFSFLTLVTKLNQWYFSLFIAAVCLPLIEKIAIYKTQQRF